MGMIEDTNTEAKKVALTQKLIEKLDELKVLMREVDAPQEIMAEFDEMYVEARVGAATPELLQKQISSMEISIRQMKLVKRSMLEEVSLRKVKKLNKRLTDLILGLRKPKTVDPEAGSKYRVEEMKRREIMRKERTEKLRTRINKLKLPEETATALREEIDSLVPGEDSGIKLQEISRRIEAVEREIAAKDLQAAIKEKMMKEVGQKGEEELSRRRSEVQVLMAKVESLPKPVAGPIILKLRAVDVSVKRRNYEAAIYEIRRAIERAEGKK